MSSPLSTSGTGLDWGRAGGGDTARSGDRAPVATARRPAVQVSDISFWKPFTLLRSCCRAALCGEAAVLALRMACLRSCSADAMSALACSSAALKPSNLHCAHDSHVEVPAITLADGKNPQEIIQ